MKLTLFIFCLFTIFLQGMSVPTCTQIQTMKAAVNTATKSQQGLVPLLVRLGNFIC
jgi:hypothetical protein